MGDVGVGEGDGDDVGVPGNDETGEQTGKGGVVWLGVGELGQGGDMTGGGE